MMTSRRLQRGAVTLIGALFIVIVLSVMAISLLRMAGSNSLDSAVQNNAVEALFVAETGIEYASSLYTSTGSCTGLSGIGPVNAGRGSFSLGNAVVQPGGDCRVPVTATVGLPGTVPAKRTLSVDLRLGQPGQAWAIGKKGKLFFWDGTTWTPSTSPTTEQLKAVTCPTLNVCWAVGKNGVVLHYVGGTWTRTVLNKKEDYEAIACAPNNPNYCFLVGKNKGGVIRFWNGTSWSAATKTTDDLKAVTCPSTVCYAVGKKKQPPLRYNGSNWLVDGTNNVSQELKGVHCYSVTGCWAVGKRQGNNYTFAQRTGSSFTWQQIQVPSGSSKPDLESVYCVSVNDCWAVGKKSKPGKNFTLVHWNGSNWSTWPSSALGKGEDLKAISCASGSDCLAVGKNGRVLHWNGSAWLDASTGTGKTSLEGVGYIGGSTGGTVTLVRWQEIIGN